MGKSTINDHVQKLSVCLPGQVLMVVHIHWNITMAYPQQKDANVATGHLRWNMFDIFQPVMDK